MARARRASGPRGTHGFRSLRSSAEHGFTLIELLVALMIFAMLSTAGVALLRGSVSAQGAVSDHLDRLADVQLALAVVETDLAQATVRITRTQNGLLAPAFFARGVGRDGPILQFVRTGWSNPDNARRPTLQKVEYWWREGRLERIGYDQLDGAPPSEPATILADVTAMTLRFRNARGEWRDDWTPSQPDLLPTLAELTLTRADRPAVTMRFLVGPGARERPDEAPIDEGGATDD